MAILIIEQKGKRQAGLLKGRVLIGRWPDNTVVIPEQSVSRIHAWVGLQEGRYYVADAGSRTGTYVNGETLRQRHILQDGDQIRIGSAVLRYRIDSAPPAETETIDLSPRSPAELSGEHGVFMDCICGAPLWLPREFVGIGQCRYCGHTVNRTPTGISSVRLPKAPASSVPAAAPPKKNPPPVEQVENNTDDFDALMDEALTHEVPAPQKPARKTPAAKLPEPLGRKSTAPAIGARVRGGAAPAVPPIPTAQPRKLEKEKDCGVCHAPITVFDEATTCPSCGLSFHIECWRENRGCSSFGCNQVGVLEKHDEPA